MGSSNSHLGSRRSRPLVSRMKRRFSSLICGSSTSYASVEMEDHPAGLLANSGNDPNCVRIDENQSLGKESSLIFSSESGCSSSKTENEASSESTYSTSHNNCIEYGPQRGEINSDRKCSSESKELVPGQVNADYEPIVSYWERTSDMASTSNKQQSPASVSLQVGTSLDSIVEVDDSKADGGFQISQELGESRASELSSVENPPEEVPGIHDSGLNFVPVVSDPLVTTQSLGDVSSQEAPPPGMGFVMPDRQQERRNGNVLHVDVVSISSNILSGSSGEINSRDARRNSRRLFWDAFSRRSSRRHSESPSMLFSSDDADDLGSHDRWLLDFGGDLFQDGVDGDSGYLGGRSHGMYERRWHSRSEIWERIRGGLDESGRRTTYCASGLHPDGTCSCETFLMADESGTRASISRIVMLAEALFEVLDEIHRQPVSFSLSMVSLPAPESVVNSFPLKSHKKLDTPKSGDDVEQCYICLAEYEEGDKIRVLPCRHEYHMSCVDKWLKEIHGVCPLCRGDVCEGGSTEASVSNS